jgi:hypothetical protein
LIGCQFFKSQRTDRGAFKSFRFEAHLRQHTADFSISAFAQRDQQSAALAITAEQFDFDTLSLGRFGSLVGQPNAMFQFLNLFVAEVSGDRNTICFGDLKAWVRERLGEIAVIGQQHQAGGFGVQTSDTKQSLFVWHQINDRRSAFWIVVGTNHTAWFVDHQVQTTRCGAANALAVDHDSIDFGIDPKWTGLNGLAVYRNTLFGDDRFACPARSDACVGQRLVKTDAGLG